MNDHQRNGAIIIGGMLAAFYIGYQVGESVATSYYVQRAHEYFRDMMEVRKGNTR